MVDSHLTDRFPPRVQIYDTTLRDGNQTVGVNFTSTQKFRIAEALIEAGVDYLEGGWPNETNPTDVEFFKLATRLNADALPHIAAFGMTCRPHKRPEDDSSIRSLLEADTRVVTVFGKSWRFQVEKVLRTTPHENMRMIHDSVEYLRSQNRSVIYDAEHFFDGYKDDPEYALSTLRGAEDAGASVIVLCDTRGGSYPSEVYGITENVLKQVHVPLGIHAHNDRGMATANSLFALMAGAEHVQGTVNGLGERVGNADLIQVVANLNLMGVKTNLQPSRLTSLSRFIYEMSGLREDPSKPFVGRSAFAHKGGVHGDAVVKDEAAYEFCDPVAFGNVRTITVSSQAGRSNMLAAAKRFGFDIHRDHPELLTLLRKVKQLESSGCNLENADATLELVIRRTLKREKEPFRVVGWTVASRNVKNVLYATCKATVRVNGKIFRSEGSGNGPVNAFDRALRSVLRKRFASKFSAKLSGYRVREVNSEAGTGARVAVYIDFTDRDRNWTTVASSTNIVEASVDALVDGYTYSLIRDKS